MIHSLAMARMSQCLSVISVPEVAAAVSHKSRNVLEAFGWLGSRVVSMLVLGAEGPGFKSELWRCRVTVLGKLFTPIVRRFTEHRN